MATHALKLTYEATAIPQSRWTARLAVFALALLVVTLILHRFGGMSTRAALGLFIVAQASAALALLAGASAGLAIWRKGGLGSGRTVAGLFVALGLLGWPLVFLPLYLTLPKLNDVTTDLASPPRFARLAAADRGQHGPYPLDRFGPLQQAAYPDLQPFLMDRSVEEAFELAVDVVRRVNRMTVVTEEPPGGRFGAAGLIEAVDRTLVVGFYDDVVLRVTGDQRQSRVDIRSASRIGVHDLGRNASRTRRLLKDLQLAIESTVPGAPLGRTPRSTDRSKIAVPKRSETDAKGKARTAPGKSQPAAKQQRPPRPPRQTFE